MPVQKFYVLALDALAKRVTRYIGRWQGHIQQNVTTDQWDCISAFFTAANAVVQCLKTWTAPS